MSFHLVWWALVFWNVSLAIATIKIGCGVVERWHSLDRFGVDDLGYDYLFICFGQ